MEIYGVILAGGKGERLWPLSRQQFPKQLLHIDQKSLLEHTVERLKTFIPVHAIFIMTTHEQSPVVAASCSLASNTLLTEPYAKNTAAAILLSCLHIAALNPDAMVLFYPADHYITDVDLFVEAQQKAIACSKEKSCVTLIGVKPTYPATGFGYIEYAINDGYAVVKRFHEKPTHEQAELYKQIDSMLWNIGIFCAKASVFIDEYKRLVPEMYELVHAYFTTGNGEFYNNVESTSVDYAIMEKSDNLCVIPANFSWSDVGNLATFLSLQKQPTQKPLEINASNNLIHVKNLLPVLIGVDDLCVVQTDDVLLITKRNDVEKVKLAVHELRKNNLEDYL